LQKNIKVVLFLVDMLIVSVSHSNGRRALRMLGSFSGENEFEEIRIAFRKGGILDSANEVHLETGEDFHVNGEGAFLMRHIKRCAGGKKIICHDRRIIEFAHIFKARELSLAK